MAGRTYDSAAPRRVLVTGGVGGIGSAVVASLAADGHACVVWDATAPLSPVAGARYMQVDLTDGDQVDRAFSTLMDDGWDRWDQLVHCAAVAHYSRIGDTSRGQWQRVIDTNLSATILLTQAIAPRLNDDGRIVLFGSGTSAKGTAEMFAYAATKAGVEGLCRSLARELGPRRITVNVVSPGFTNTPMVDDFRATEADNVRTRAIEREATVDDVVGPVRFFLSDAASFVTGQALNVDGGSVMR